MGSVIILSICCFVLPGVLAQECLLATGINIDRQLPNFEDRGDVSTQELIRVQNQAIVASYQFQCCGNITEWGADVYRDTSREQNTYIIAFQVWRPSPAVQSDGCYSLVGENRYTSVSLTNGLIRQTPLPAERVSFQPGDVLGFYIDTTIGQNRRGVVLDPSYSYEAVWYGSIDDTAVRPSECPFPVGPNGTFTNAGPVITVSTILFSCPTSIQSLQSSTAHISLQPTPTPSTSTLLPSSPPPNTLNLLPSLTTKLTTSSTERIKIRPTMLVTSSTGRTIIVTPTTSSNGLTSLQKMADTNILTATPTKSSLLLTRGPIMSVTLVTPTETLSGTISPLTIGLIAGLVTLAVLLLLVLTICVGVFAKNRTKKGKI